MNLWMIENGTKVGPFEDYEIRERIREGKITGDTPMWHEGASGWTPAREISILVGEFESKEITPPPLPIVMPPFLVWRRFGARVFDYFLYLLIFLFVLRVMGFNTVIGPAQQESAWMIIGKVIPVILMEAALLSSLGWTPGKWFLSLRVENLEGEMLPTSHALVRSMRVWVLGMGMMHSILLILGHAITLWFGKKKGAPLWDLHSGFRVPATALVNARLIGYWVSLALIIVLIGVVIWPDAQPLLEAEMAKQQK